MSTNKYHVIDQSIDQLRQLVLQLVNDQHIDLSNNIGDFLDGQHCLTDVQSDESSVRLYFKTLAGEDICLGFDPNTFNL